MRFIYKTVYMHTTVYCDGLSQCKLLFIDKLTKNNIIIHIILYITVFLKISRTDGTGRTGSFSFIICQYCT